MPCLAIVLILTAHGAEPIRWAVPVASCGAPLSAAAVAEETGLDVVRFSVERCTLDVTLSEE